MDKKKPNIIIFMPETVRADAVLGEETGRAKTPNIDRLAGEGVSFSGCFSQSPFCTPSRCSMFTGLYPHVNGHRSLHFLLQKHERNLFMDLKENGYFTAALGKNDLLSADAVPLSFDLAGGKRRGKKRIFIPGAPPGGKMETRKKLARRRSSFYEGEKAPGRDGDWENVETALDIIGGKRGKPFCIFLPLRFAHPPYAAEEPFFSMHDRSKTKPHVPAEYHGKTRAFAKMYELRELSGLDEADLAEIRATYYGMVSRLDYQLGLIIDALKEEGLYEETAVFVCSDHGDYAGDYGHVEKINYSFEDCLLNIPLIARIPGKGGGISRKCLLEAIDLYPAILELAGVQGKHYHFGRSFLRLFDRCERDFHRDSVFAEAGTMEGETHCRTPLEPHIGSAYEKTIRYRHEHPEEMGRISHRRIMIRNAGYKYVYSPLDFEEFYDLQKDPRETVNAAGLPEYEPVERGLKDRMLKWLVETSDVSALERDGRGF